MKITLPLFIIVSFMNINAFSQEDALMDSLLNAGNPKKEYVEYTFKTTRVINAHSIETVKKGGLDFRVSHRFGNLADSSFSHSFFGLSSATDVLIAFEYGITDRLQVGIGRTQGAGPIRELYNGNLKYALFKQTKDNHMPISLTLYGNAAISSMKKSTDSTSLSYFRNVAHRTSYLAQIIIARKFNEWFSLELLPTYLHRNLVRTYDENDLFSIGYAMRVKFNKRFGMIFDGFIPISTWRLKNSEVDPYYIPLGVGFEWETGGHVFHLNFTNSTGLLENDFIPYTNENWAKGGFRFGFTISRVFQLHN